MLIVDPRTGPVAKLRRALDATFTVLVACTAAEAETVLDSRPVTVITCFARLPDADGISFLTAMCSRHPSTQRILLATKPEPMVMLRGINEARLFRLLQDPIAPEELAKEVDLAVIEYDIVHTMEFVEAENHRLKQELQSWSGKSQRFGHAMGGALHHTGRFVVIAGTMIAGLIAVVTVLAVLGFGTAYLVKTFLGIDLFEGLHLDDILARILPSR